MTIPFAHNFLPALGETLYAVISERSGVPRLFSEGATVQPAHIDAIDTPEKAMIEAYFCQLKYGRCVVAPMRRVGPDEIVPARAGETGGNVVALYAPVMSRPEDDYEPWLQATPAYEASLGREQAEWLDDLVRASPGSAGCLMRIEVPKALLI